MFSVKQEYDQKPDPRRGADPNAAPGYGPVGGWGRGPLPTKGAKGAPPGFAPGYGPVGGWGRGPLPTKGAKGGSQLGLQFRQV